MVGIAALLFLFSSVSTALTYRFLSGVSRATAEVVSSNYMVRGRSASWVTEFAFTKRDGDR